MKLWLAGRNSPSPAKSVEILGLYDSEDAAVKRCTQYWDFVGPLMLNEALPEETVAWPGAYYPLGLDFE